MNIAKRALFSLLALGMVGCSSSSTMTVTPTPKPLPADPDLLIAPAAGLGMQLKTNDVVVPAGSEEQDCYFFRVSDLAVQGGLPADQPVQLHHIQVVQKPGSHHMNLFRVKTIANLDPANGAVQAGTNGMGQCFVSSNWADWPLVANMQAEGNLDWTYPDGVVNALEPDEYLMLQTHYVNATTQTTPGNAGKVAVNLIVLPAAEVTAQMGTLFATDQSIRICEHLPTPTFKETCQFAGGTAAVNVIGANGHFHSRGVEFDMFSWDGMSTTQPPETDRFYQSTTWDSPPMTHSPGLNLVVPPGGGVWYTCQYKWTPPIDAVGCDGLNAIDAEKQAAANPPTTEPLDCCYRFGPLVDSNEHCNAFVYYYPKQDDVTCQ